MCYGVPINISNSRSFSFTYGHGCSVRRDSPTWNVQQVLQLALNWLPTIINCQIQTRSPIDICLYLFTYLLKHCRWTAKTNDVNPFFVSRRTSCYRRRTTCSVREDKVCPPSLSKSSDKACNQTGTYFHGYNLQKHLYVVICIFYLFHGQCLLLHGRPRLINITYFVDSASKCANGKSKLVLIYSLSLHIGVVLCWPQQTQRLVNERHHCLTQYTNKPAIDPPPMLPPNCEK